MALVALFCGYTSTHSLIGIVIAQVLMGISMPPLVYLSLRPWLPRTAYWAAIASIFSLGPFLLSKTLHHDQPYIFFLIFSLYLANRYMATKRRRKYLRIYIFDSFSLLDPPSRKGTLPARDHRRH